MSSSPPQEPTPEEKIKEAELKTQVDARKVVLRTEVLSKLVKDQKPSLRHVEPVARTAKANPTAVLVPMKLDAFVLNEAICSRGKAFIAPLSQPDYRGLEPGPRLKHDVVPHLDLHAAIPVSTNTRLVDLDTGKARMDRLGVYLHWTLPKPFRAGITATEQSDKWYEQQRGLKGLSSAPSSRASNQPPSSSLEVGSFFTIPTGCNRY